MRVPEAISTSASLVSATSRIVCGAIGALLLLAGSVTLVPAQPSSLAMARKLSSVVQITVTRSNGETVTGRGVVAGVAERVLTERSLLVGARTILVRGFSSFERSSATIVSEDSVTGLAVLRAPGLSAIPADVSSRALVAKDSIVLVMFERNADLIPLQRGARVAAIESYENGSVAVLSENIVPEENGTPVLNGAKELVGIAFVSSSDRGDRTYVIPVKPTSVEVTSVVARGTAAIPTTTKTTTERASQVSGKSATQTIAAKGQIANARTVNSDLSARLVVTGLQNATLLSHVFAGTFDAIAMEPGSIEFQALFQAYLQSCAVRCAASLPPDKVHMQTLECVETSTPVNVYGAPVGPERCSRREYKGTGLYADPRLYDAKNKSAQRSMQESVQQVVKVLSSGLTAPLDLAASMLVFRKEMDALLQMNGCATPVTRRFQENLRLFALGLQPLALSVAGTESRPPAVTITDADFNRLLQDLISDNAAKWISNRYRDGSAGNAVVAARDAAGRPTRLAGVYLFESYNGLTRGTVTLDFSEGVPSCLYFFDAPSTCHKPPRAMVSAYVKGEYASGYNFTAAFKAEGVKTVRVSGDFYKSCVAERIRVTRELNDYMDENYWTPYCRCLERQYQPVLTDAEWLRYVNDFAQFERIFKSNEQPTNWRLYEPRNACVK